MIPTYITAARLHFRSLGIVPIGTHEFKSAAPSKASHSILVKYVTILRNVMLYVSQDEPGSVALSMPHSVVVIDELQVTRT